MKAAFVKQLGTRRPVDGAIDASASQKR